MGIKNGEFNKAQLITLEFYSAFVCRCFFVHGKFRVFFHAVFFAGALEGEGAEHVDVVPFGELVAVAEGAAGGDDGVVQRPAGEIYLCVHASTSPFLNTGPSLQTRLAPLFVWQVQPTQAPKPQPMRSS